MVSVEVPYFRELVERFEFDTIYHEHLCYFSLTSLVRLFARHGLAVVDVERLPVHGGSLRVFARAEGAEALGRRSPSCSSARSSGVSAMRHDTLRSHAG